MNDYDPFGGSPANSDYNDYNSKSSNKSKITTIILVILLIAIIGYFAYTLFFSNSIVSFAVKDTEGGRISDAKIMLAKDEAMKEGKITINSEEKTKLQNGTYFYKAYASGFNTMIPEEIKISDDLVDEPIVLQKNIALKITKIDFPTKIFAGQTIVVPIEISNSSPSESYDFNYLVIKGDANIANWPVQLVDVEGNLLDSSAIIFQPQMIQNILLKMTVPATQKAQDNLKMNIRVKYKLEDKSTQTFSIIKEPEVTVTMDLKGILQAGQSKDITYSIDNKKNDISITDIVFELDINSDSNNSNIENWFALPTVIAVEKKSKKTDSFKINVPITASAGKITGNLIIKSSAFGADKNIPIDFEIKEPDIALTTSLEKNTVNLTFDSNLGITDDDYVTLKIENKNNFPITMAGIYLLNASEKQDCNNFIYIPQTYRLAIPANDKEEIELHVMAINPNEIGTLVNNSRVCTILVRAEHPFRTDELLEKTNNLTVYVR